MKKLLIAFLVVGNLGVLSILSLAVYDLGVKGENVSVQLKALESEVKAWNKIEIPPNVIQRIETGFNDVAKQIYIDATNVLREEIINADKVYATQIESSLKGSFGEINAELATNIQRLNKSNTENYTIVANRIFEGNERLLKVIKDNSRQLAECWSNEYYLARCEYLDAMRLAEEAKSAGEYDMACNYVVNAIAHRRKDIQCFNLYFDIIKSAESSAEWKQEHIERLEKYIVSAVVGGAATEIKYLVSLAGAVRRASEEMLAQMPSEDEMESVLRKEEIARDKITEFIGHISVLKKKMEDGGVNKELYVGMIRSDYQNIDVLYSALIGEDDTEMDKRVVAECGELYRDVKQAQIRFERDLSEPYYKAICDEVEKIKGDCGNVDMDWRAWGACGQITKKLKDINRRVADVRAEMLKITDEKMAHEVTSLLTDDIAKCLDELSRKRMEVYQQFAIEQITMAAKIYDRNGSKFDDDKKDVAMRDAWRFLRLVSPGLLVPEVSEFYSSVWNKLFDSYADGQEGPQDGMENSKDLKKTTRWKIQRAKERGRQLEDF